MEHELIINEVFANSISIHTHDLAVILDWKNQ